MPRGITKPSNGAIRKLNEEEQFLQREISQYIKREFSDSNHQPSRKHITIYSSLLELSERIGSAAEFNLEYEERKRIAPIWPIALKLWIDEIENDFLGYKEIVASDGYPGTIGRAQLIRPALHSAYSDIMAGKNRCIHEYIDKLVFPRKNSTDKYFDSEGLVDLGKGTALAYGLPKLKQELVTINSEGQNGISADVLSRKKIIWKATPSQLGFILIELNGKGYLDFPVSGYNKIAQFLMEIMDIRNSDGVSTTPGTLAKEINPNSNSISADNASLLRLPVKEKLK